MQQLTTCYINLLHAAQAIPPTKVVAELLRKTYPQPPQESEFGSVGCGIGELHEKARAATLQNVQHRQGLQTSRPLALVKTDAPQKLLDAKTAAGAQLEQQKPLQSSQWAKT